MAAIHNDSDFLRFIDELREGVYIVDASRRIVAWSRGAERITGFDRASVLGTRCSDNVLTHVNDDGCCMCQGRCPLQATMDDGEPRAVKAFLHHNDGHRVPVSISTTPLHDGDGARCGAFEIFTDLTERMVELDRLRELERHAYLDELTELATRRGVLEQLERELRRVADEEGNGDDPQPFGVVMLDIDRFKQINDTYGHQAGDQVLRMVAETVRANCRSEDLAGRWGGEEFLIVTGPTRRGVLYSFAQRLRTLVSGSFILHEGERISVTASLGATLVRAGDDIQSLVNRADQLMYRSKESGRNRLSIAA